MYIAYVTTCRPTIGLFQPAPLTRILQDRILCPSWLQTFYIGLPNFQKYVLMISLIGNDYYSSPFSSPNRAGKRACWQWFNFKRATFFYLHALSALKFFFTMVLNLQYRPLGLQRTFFASKQVKGYLQSLKSFLIVKIFTDIRLIRLG